MTSVVNATSYPTNTGEEDRKHFKYYVGIDDRDVVRLKLVAWRQPNGKIDPNFSRDDILDASNRFIDGIYFINKKGIIEEYDIDNTLVENTDLPVEASLNITKIEDLYSMRFNLDGDYVLQNDLDFNNDDHYRSLGNKALLAEWTPIGTSTAPFTGSINGNTNTISNLKIDNSTTDYMGFFGYSTNVDIRDLTIENASVTGKDNVGILSGYCRNGAVNNVTTSGSVTGGLFVGGLIGFSDVDIDTASSSATVNGNNTVGGAIGYSQNRPVRNISATGNVSGEKSVGGLIGDNRASLSLSHATGAVQGTGTTDGYNYVGGLIGKNYQTSVSRCYATGNVTAQGVRIGGLIGNVDGGGTISDVYSTGNVIGTTQVGGLFGYVIATVRNGYTTGNVTANGGGASGTTNSAWKGGVNGSFTNTFSTGNVVADTSYANGVYTGGDASCYSGNYRLDTATVKKGDAAPVTTNGTTTTNDGQNETVTNLQSEAFLTGTLGWDASATDTNTIWKVNVGAYPTLR